MYFKSIRKTLHYIANHENSFPWSKVIEIIFSTKNMRKKGNNSEIETDKYYLLCRLESDVLWVVNAKWKR